MKSFITWVIFLLFGSWGHVLAGVDSLTVARLYARGTALCEENRCEEALRLWQPVVARLAFEQEDDFRLADRFVREVFRRHFFPAYATAAEAYLRMLMDRPRGETVRQRYRAQLSVLFPDEGTLPTGQALLAWWNRQDPYPATSLNERLVEHLERVAHAEEAFPARHLRGFDDRGMLYVRFGRPRTRATLHLDTHRLVRRLREAGIQPAGAFVPVPNEFWTYEHLGEEAHFLLIQSTDGYRIGEPLDLVPDYLFSASSRGGAATVRRLVAEVLLDALLQVYEGLALRHTAYEDMRVWLERLQAEARMTEGQWAPNWGQMLRSEVRRTTLEYRRARAERLPASYSSLGEGQAILSTAYRLTRFLSNEGQTTLHIAWSHDPADLQVTRWKGMDAGERFLVDFSFVPYVTDFVRGDVVHRQYLIRPTTDPAVQQLTVDLPAATVGVGVEWDLIGVRQRADGQWEQTRFLATTAAVTESLVPLKRQGLEMSDLLPVRVEGERRIPYPFTTLSEDLPLSVYFEIYHLTPQPDGSVRYTVSYTVRDETGAEVAAHYRAVAQSTSTQELVELDLQPFRGKKELLLLVCVEDDLTGMTVERRLPLMLVSR